MNTGRVSDLGFSFLLRTSPRISLRSFEQRCIFISYLFWFFVALPSLIFRTIIFLSLTMHSTCFAVSRYHKYLCVVRCNLIREPSRKRSVHFTIKMWVGSTVLGQSALACPKPRGALDERAQRLGDVQLELPFDNHDDELSKPSRTRRSA